MSNLIVSVPIDTFMQSTTQSGMRTALGLGSVENVALSTWAGSANLTTLGTIGSGVWQGSAINDGYIASAASWNAKQPGDATLSALAAYNANGLLTQTAADTFAGRTIAGTASRISLTNGNGVAGNPTIDIDAAYVGQTSITTLGTIGTGSWNATAIADGKIASALTGKTYNGLTLTAAATGFTLAGGTASKTLTVLNSITLAGTDSTTITFPATSATVAGLGITQTFTGVNSFSNATPIQLESTSTSGLQIFNTSDKVTNYERINLFWTSNVAVFSATQGGTGTGRSLALKTAANTLTITPGGSTGGEFLLAGASSSLAGNVIALISGTSTATSGACAGLSITPVYNQASGSAANTDLLVNRTQTAIGSGAQLFADFQLAGSSRFSVNNAGLITTNSVVMMASSQAWTNGAGASAGTLSNAPAVGNPTKWIPVNDNGTTRYLPAW